MTPEALSLELPFDFEGSMMTILRVLFAATLGLLIGLSTTSPSSSGEENEANSGVRSPSPFHTHPAEIAQAEPCRFIGTFHKESRNRLEQMRTQRVISSTEWTCMAQALKKLDSKMTTECAEKKQPLRIIESWQVELYTPCIRSEKKTEILRCSLLSADTECPSKTSSK